MFLQTHEQEEDTMERFMMYLTMQIEEILPYWILGIVLGSALAVFGKSFVHGMVMKMGNSLGLFGVVPASVLGILSPLCMYGTLPLAASLSRRGLREDWLAAFMMSSVLLNPQMIIYVAALGKTLLILTLLFCFLCGALAGVLVHFLAGNRRFFNFSGFGEAEDHDTDPRMGMRLLKNMGRNVKATGGWFFLGILTAVLFQTFLPAGAGRDFFGHHEMAGPVLGALLGIPFYVCGGGAVPLLLTWMEEGMSGGAVIAFLLTGPATKVTNLTALKTVFGARHFVLYSAYIIVFALAAGITANWVMTLS